MRVVAIIQARMESTRLPGKVLMDIGGETMLSRVVHRSRRAALVDEIVVATTVKPNDDAIVAECKRIDAPIFRGEEENVLDRYFKAAEAYRAEAVVRITSDCPLIDPEIVDEIVHVFLKEKPDYASNALERTFPRGLETEVMTLDSIGRVWREAREAYQRVHVTPYIYQNPALFRLLSVTAEADYSDHRWTVDTPADLDFVQAVYARLGNDDSFSWRHVLKILDREPDLMDLNRHIRQKALEEG